jgi:hypothetical protein
MQAIVHAIFYYSYRVQTDLPIIVWENMYFIEANDIEHAKHAMNAYLRELEDVSGNMECNGIPSDYRFAGIRKIILVEETDIQQSAAFLNKIEVTYSVYEVRSHADILALAEGRSVNLVYQE